MPAAALHSTDFPNPGAAAAPSYQGTVGFPGREVNRMRDFGQFWFNPNQTAGHTELETTQAYTAHGDCCYANRGQRWSGRAWPGEAALFTRVCQ